MGNKDDIARPVGPPVPDWTPPPKPSDQVLEGRYARLEPLRAETHAAQLFRRYEGHDAVWDYLPYGPISSLAQYHRWVRATEDDTSTLFRAVRNADTGRYEGVASFLRIDPNAGSIEVGHINFSPSLQGSRAATEALFLMMSWAFEAGYRRFEWKCDALNRPSRRAAQRLGLSYEGIFRQATIVKGRNRDTAWFATIDSEWPVLESAFRTWLDPANFDAQGRQILRLSDLTRPVLVMEDPIL